MFKRVGVIGSFLLAVALLIGAIAAVSASAVEPPDFGRCLAQTRGKYEDSGCNLAAKGAGRGKFEWLPGVVKTKLATRNRPGTLVTIETLSGEKVVCYGEQGPGGFTGGKTVVVTPVLTGCEMGGAECNTAGASAGTILLSPLKGVLGILATMPEPSIGLELSPASGEVVMEFECTGILKTVVRGAGIGRFLPRNVMWTEPSVTLEGSSSKQFPESFRNGPPEFFESSLDGTPYERTGLTLTMMLMPEEAIEASIVN